MRSELLQLLNVAGLAVYVGAMLTEGAILVPYWRSLPAGDFFTWYRVNDRRLLRFFGPLTGVAAVLAVAAAVVAVVAGAPGWRWACGAAALMITAAATFFVYYEAANARFAAASIRPADLAAELGRWAVWHWARTALGAAALAAAMLALAQSRP
jgi:hypothetical protein